jgi:hypothetical protein
MFIVLQFIVDELPRRATIIVFASGATFIAGDFGALL